MRSRWAPLAALAILAACSDGGVSTGSAVIPTSSAATTTAPRANSRPCCQLERPSSGRFSAYWPSTQRVKPSPTKGALIVV